MIEPRQGVFEAFKSMLRPNRIEGVCKRSARLPRFGYFLRHATAFIIAALIFADVGVAIATAQETPHLIKSGVMTLRGWCGEDSLILNQGGRDDPFEVIWLDLLTKRQITLLSVPALDKIGEHLAMGPVDCSPDGRWILAKYSPYRDEGSRTCESFRKDLPKVILWDTKEDKRYEVGEGYWEFRWAPNGSMLIYRFQVTCNLERDQRTSFRLPPSVMGLHAVSAREVVRRALGPNSGWTVNDHIASLNWVDADHLVAELIENRHERDDELREGNAQGGGPVGQDPTITVKLLIYLKNGVGVRAEQLHSGWDRLSSGVVVPKLAIPQISEADTDDLLQAFICGVGARNFPDCWSPEIHREPAKINLERYCRRLDVGDVERFCKAAPTTRGATWTRLRHRGRVLLLREYYAVIPSPGEPDDKMSDLFLIENDEGGYLK